MKMAEKSIMLTFQNNCESINSKCVEVKTETEEKIGDNDITEIETESNINKLEDKPHDNDLNNISSGTREDATEIFLAAENKTDFNDELLLETIVAENEGIEFKRDNVIPDLEKSDLFSEVGQDEEDDVDDDKLETFELGSPNSAEEDQETGDAQCLTKMQIMEDVREGCSVQPSSPGHAEEQRLNSEDPTKVSSDHEENGFEEETFSSGNHIEEEDKKETDTDEGKEDKTSNNELENGDSAEKTEHHHSDNHTMNEESSSNTSSEGNCNKRKSENVDCPTKRLRMDIQDNFLSRDKILHEFIEIAECNTVDQMQLQTEQVLAEIRTLNELAKDKEREWNNIIHLKKMKEELLLRMQRRKQVMLLTNDKGENGDGLYIESQSDGVNERLKSNQSILKSNLSSSNKNLRGADKNKQRSLLPKPQHFTPEMNGAADYRQNKQRPVLDVQSIIADYRQRHPETVPRRGRRIRHEKLSNSNVLNFASLALGSGAQCQDANTELGILLNAMDANRIECSRPSSAESSTQSSEPSFKDMLVQFAKLSQSERHELIQNAIKPPPPYPEVTVHPVPTTTTVAPTNSLLHGILTKSPSKTNSKTSFSPTLARLLTAPERSNQHSPTAAAASLANHGNMSISEILSTSKARNEITITPVATQYEAPAKNKTMEEEEAEDSADRLVIDESSEVQDARGRGDNSSEAGDEVPQCQGCNQKSALFVCAGCGNQWYCSRDCQVSAWDEHSEVCSG